MKILLIRLMGLGDVACIEVLTYGAGAELMSLVPGVAVVHVTDNVAAQIGPA